MRLRPPCAMDFSPPETKRSFKEAFTRERAISRFTTLENLLRHFRPGERLFLYVLAVLLGASALALLAGANAAVSTEMPAEGGTHVEGLLGPARFINPILALSKADEDLTSLIYSGLVRALPDGSVVPDLAQSYEISADGMTYTFKLRPDATFHDGTPVTSADVLFSVQTAQNPDFKSPHRANWEGVTVAIPDEQTITFTLARAYAPFIYNTMMGVLPRHLWRNVSAEDFPFSPLNTRPIGSGPYAIKSYETDTTGAAVRYDLARFEKFTLGKPYLKNIRFLFYPNEAAMINAFNQGSIDSIAGVSPDRLASLDREDTVLMTVPLPRIYGIFFNQNHSAALSDIAARRALDLAIDKGRLVSQVLHGFGTPVESPLPPAIEGTRMRVNTPSPIVSTAYTQETLDAAREKLTDGGWSFSEETGAWSKGGRELSFSLATVDSPELVTTADAVATAWRQLGIKVTVQVYPVAELNSTIIRPREYDALLFGEVVGRELDLFAFWHSSQRNDPGLNLALYTNSSADQALSQARATTNSDERRELYEEFARIVAEDQPAVFLYAPEFIYVVPKELRGISFGALTTAGERFLNVQEWYRDTEYVWNFLVNK